MKKQDAKLTHPITSAGEAIFVDDIPSPMNCLYGAFIYSTKPFAKVKSIKFKSKSLPFGVAALICFKDIPKDGENIGSKSIFGAEPLFADEMTRYAGERIALVVICNISFYFYFFLIYH